MPTLDEQVNAIDSALAAVIEDSVKLVTLEATANLVEATPVKTGWARANWLPSVVYPVSEPAGAPDAVSGAEQANGIAQVAAYKLADGSAYVTNCVPYITKLDQGSSQQAPAGFVQAAIDQAIVTAQQEAAEGVSLLRDKFEELNATLGLR